MAKLPRKGDEGPITAYLIMLDRLSRRSHSNIEHRLVINVAHDFLGFGNDTVDRLAGNALWLQPKLAEDLIEPGNLLFGLLQMACEPLFNPSLALNRS